MNTLLTACQHARMLANGTANAKHIAEDGNTQDFWPVVKLFCPWGAATWLLSELDPEDEDIAAVRGPGGLRIERDRHFKPTKSLTAYAAEAADKGRVLA